MNVEDFWEPFEVKVHDFNGLVSAINTIMGKAKNKNRQFAWRGLVDYRWALHSSLYRRLRVTKSRDIMESDLLGEEDKVMAELHRWGLHCAPPYGRMSYLNQLAVLQHYGAPTRLIDITFNAWVGVWFAVEKKWENGGEKYEDTDGRLFAIDVTDRLINEDRKLRRWEDYCKCPWRSIKSKNWQKAVYAWKPASIDRRIFAQNGGFIFGGVPTASGPALFQFPKTTSASGGVWPIGDARKSCCLALRPHIFKGTSGGVAGSLYTFRISADAKSDIRNHLERMFGYKHSTIYPDFTGFSSYGTPLLKSY